MRILTASLALLPLLAGQSLAQVYGAWAKYRPITINTATASGGAGVTEAQANVPVLVRLSALSTATGANALAEAKAGGADIRFANAAGDAALPYEIERWTATGADIWVKVPTVAGNASTQIRLYWGNSAATSESSGPSVFDTTAGGFTTVWHMNGAGSGGMVNENDATGGGLTATQVNSSGTNAASSDVGGVGYYRVLSGTDDATGQGFTTNNPARANFLNTQAYTISAWVRPSSYDHVLYPTIVSKHDAQWSLRANTNEAGLWLFFHGNGSSWPGVNSSETATLNQWSHVAGVRSQTPNAMLLYVNGALVATTDAPASGGTQTTNTSVAIGRRSEAADRYWNGAIGEIRLENVARSAARIKFDYETQKPGATALVLGATASVQARALFYPTKVANYARNIAIEANTPVVTGTATSFSVNQTLPAGLTFNTTTGVISGTPTTLSAAGQFIVTANLQGGGTGLDTLTLAVVAGEAPGVPSAPVAVAGQAQATVTWTAPLVTGSGAITGYTVRAVQDTAKSCQWTTGALSCVVTGLTNGTAYTFTVRASNGAGTSAASAPSNSVTPAGLPGAPTAVTATLLSGAGASPSVRVNWTAPASNGGGAISLYTATSNPAGGTCSALGTSLNCTISSGLTYGMAYTFTVTATNSAGAGPASSASAPFTPVGLHPGSFTIHKAKGARPFTFTLTKEALESEEAFTLSIVDSWGRTVWSRTAHPSKDGTRELSWDGRSSNGRAASAGVYIVRLSGGGTVRNFVEKTLAP